MDTSFSHSHTIHAVLKLQQTSPEIAFQWLIQLKQHKTAN